METNLTDADVFSEMITPDGGDFPPEAARALLDLTLSAKAITRMNELAEKNRLDAISATEKEEMEKYRRAGNFLSVIKAKARLSLSKRSEKQ